MRHTNTIQRELIISWISYKIQKITTNSIIYSWNIYGACYAKFNCRSFFSSDSNLANRPNASPLLPSPWTGSGRPVSKFILETGFFSKLSPISTSACIFFTLATSSDAASPANLSSYSHQQLISKLSNKTRNLTLTAEKYPYSENVISLL